MMIENWLEWTTKQLQDMSLKLKRQGYDPQRIEHLTRINPAFREAHQAFSSSLDAICAAMAEDPEGYSHYDALLQAKQEFLLYTNRNRAFLLQSELAETA